MPKWSTPERRAKLVELWQQYGNRCQYGHHLCPTLEHYVHQSTSKETAHAPHEAGPKVVTNKRTGRQYAYGVGVTIRKDYLGDKPKVEAEQTYSLQEHFITTVELATPFVLASEDAIADWKAEDREERSQQRWLASQTTPTGQGHKFPKLISTVRHHHPTDPVSFDEYTLERPEWILLGNGVDATTGHKVAKVKIPGAGVVLWVDISTSIQETSRGQRKRLKRRGIQPDWSENVITEAVREWWAK